MLRFTNCRLCDRGILTAADLYVDQQSGKIVPGPGATTGTTGAADGATDGDIHTIDLRGQILAPGYIDIQNNGVYGLNFSSLNGASSAAETARFRAFYRDSMAKYLATGVTALCPTVTSSFPEVYEKVLPVYRKTRASAMADSLGAHLEGPFISAHKKGCHPVETFVDGESASFEAVYGADNLSHNVAIVTAAPEVPGVLQSIPRLVKRGVVFSIGHTAADHDTCVRAVASGATMVTHLYNAMPQPHHRETGVVGLVAEPAAGAHTPHFGLICDGVHVAPEMCVMAYRANPRKCVLTTDAMHLMGLPDGTYSWDKQRIVKTGPTLYLEGTTTLAGAATGLPEGVQNLVRWARLSLAEAVRTVTNNAADSLGISHKGYLDAGCDADLVVLDNHGNVCQVYKLGRRVGAPRDVSL